jgi:hypothetical protein
MITVHHLNNSRSQRVLVMRRNVIVDIECVKQLPMSARPLSHHPRFSRSKALASA